VMVELRLDEIAARIGGHILQGDPAHLFDKFNFDSRLSEPGELFFALVAKRNGHDFIPDAARKGAQGAVISQDVPLRVRDFALVQVADTMAALQTLAKAVLHDHPLKIVGITGSIGKTTTKEFAASLLSSRFSVHKSEGNFNNYLGLSLSLLRITPCQQISVLEMGTSAPGELRGLTRIAPPDVSVITNINPVHLEFFHTLEGIARAKKEILEGTKKGGTAVLNGDDVRVRKIARDWNGESVFFGLSPRCDVRASSIRKMGMEGLEFELRLAARKEKVRFPFLYEDYLYNLLAAVGVCRAFSVPFESIIGQISELRPFSNRGNLISLGRGIKLIDDSYNSNPKALEGVLVGLAGLPAKRKVAVLGDMLELGEKEAAFHRRAGKMVVESSWDVLITIGPLSLDLAEGALSAGMPRGRVFSFAASEEAAEKVPALVQEGDLVLVKGSRGIRTEKVVEKLKEEFREN
jgi:UDP-N-acetylmuramoyl-tripeptide--D-alanyl-D-alanine ligase